MRVSALWHWPFPFLLGRNLNSLWFCCSSHSHLQPLMTLRLLSTSKRKPADGWPHPPTHTEPPVSPACAMIGKTPVNGCTVGLLHPHQQRTVYLQVEWWNTGNTLQRNQANLPRRASSSQSGSRCPRIGPSCFGIGQRMDSNIREKWFEPRLPQLTIHPEGKPAVCHTLHTCPDRWSGISGWRRARKGSQHPCEPST